MCSVLSAPCSAVCTAVPGLFLRELLDKMKRPYFTAAHFETNSLSHTQAKVKFQTMFDFKTFK